MTLTSTQPGDASDLPRGYVVTARQRLQASAETPDGSASVHIRGVSGIRLVLAPGYFHRASARDLEFQLTRLAKLAFVARMREYYRGRGHELGRDLYREPSPRTDRDRTYVDARSQVVAEGGAGGPVEVTAVGMEHWTVRIDPAWHATVDEQTFCDTVSSVASRLVEDQFAKIRQLKVAVYADREGTP